MLGSTLSAGLHPEGFSGILGLKNGLDCCLGAWPNGFLKHLSRTGRHFDTFWPLLPNTSQGSFVGKGESSPRVSLWGRREMFAPMLGICVAFLDALSDNSITALKMV